VAADSFSLALWPPPLGWLSTQGLITTQGLISGPPEIEIDADQQPHNNIN
jgi:hypothetical protein